MRESLAFTLPHFEQVLLDGYQRSTTCSAAPLRAVLYSNCLRNSPNAASDTALASRRFFTMPATFRSSMHTVLYVRAIMVVALCIASSRWFATRAWSRATFALALARRFEPLVLWLNAFWARFSFRSDFRSARGFSMTVPSESVANVLRPRSTPTAPPFGARAAVGMSRSTVSAAYQRPARRETVIRNTLAPLTRAVTSSRQCTRPTFGRRSAFGSPSISLNPVVYANLGATLSFDLNFGNPTFRPLRSPRRLFDQLSKPLAKASRPLL